MEGGDRLHNVYICGNGRDPRYQELHLEARSEVPLTHTVVTEVQDETRACAKLPPHHARGKGNDFPETATALYHDGKFGVFLDTQYY